MAAALMPDFTGPTHAFHHTLDSALSILSKLNVSPARVSLAMDGRGYPTRWVVSQSPAPGAPLDGGVCIDLRVAGTGLFHALPAGMWDKGGEAEPGTCELLGPFDDPFQKASHWVREGARLFDIQPDNFEACAKWIGLFGLNAEEWPRDLWYNLSVLLPNVHSLAGREHGIRFALWLLLGLPLDQIRRSKAFSYLTPDCLTRLGGAFSRMSVDAAIGNRAEDLALLTLVLGPVSLAGYYSFQSGSKLQLLHSVLDLIMPMHQQWAIDWLVLDRSRPPRLGFETENARLGINSHLGSALNAEQSTVYAQ